MNTLLARLQQSKVPHSNCAYCIQWNDEAVILYIFKLTWQKKLGGTMPVQSPPVDLDFQPWSTMNGK